MSKHTGKVWISDIDVQGFCEYKIYLKYVLDLPDPGGVALEDGRAVHKALELASQLNAQSAMRKRIAVGLNVPTTIKEMVDVARNEGESWPVREVHVEGERIVGMIDQIDFTPEKIYIIEDKSPSKNGKPFFGQIRQVQGYCLAFSEQHPEIDLPLVAVIRDKYSRKDMWVKPFTQDDIPGVNEAIDRIIGIVDGTWIPVPSISEVKHSVCSWNSVCDKSHYRG